MGSQPIRIQLGKILQENLVGKSCGKFLQENLAEKSCGKCCGKSCGKSCRKSFNGRNSLKMAKKHQYRQFLALVGNF